jgi:phage protein U
MGGSGRIKAVASFNNEKKIKLCDGLGGAPMGPYTVEQIANQTTLVIRDGNPEYPRYAAMFLTQHKRDLPRKDELPK